MSAPASHFIAGRWVAGTGAAFASDDPATGATNWQGRAANEADVGAAVASARAAATSWVHAPLADRVRLVEAVAQQYRHRKTDLAEAVSRETGKPRWEALAEVDAMAAKVPISIEAYNERCRPTAREFAGASAATRFRPHGVVAVFGPFNMPGHLPNGHLVPAVLAGNAAVFKPSEQAPLVGQKLAEAWEAALQSCGQPPGLFNLVQGGPPTGIALARHPGVDGLFFTGSAGAGMALSRALADDPGKILALEMGGNNPLIVHEASDLRAGAYVTVQSAFVTAGQRCSCARRLIVPDGTQGDAFVNELVSTIGRIRAGYYTDEPEPFMGTVISASAAKSLLDAQAALLRRGAKTVVEMRSSSRSPALLSPGLIDVSAMSDRDDAELFGPLLQLIRVPDFDAAISEANRTRYGLSAGLVSDRRDLYERFFRSARAGVVNWNRPLTGASSHLPFGGVGMSGNHRPSAYHAADYCSYPVASLESDRATMPAQLPPGLSSVSG